MESEILALEHSFLKVPHEQVAKTTRAAQQLLDSELQLVTAQLDQIVSQASSTSPLVVAKEIDALMEQLIGLREQMNGLEEVERHLLETAETRLTHLEAGMVTPLGTADADVWKQQRLDRIICDHLLRVGQYDTAEALANLGGIEAFTNLSIFKTSKGIETALHNRDCGPALLWCEANRTRLTKLRSSLEFKLHLQVYIQQVRAGDRNRAIEYAKTHFGPHTETHLKDIQVAMALLVFKTPTVERHCELLAEERWDNLVQQFRRNIFALHSLSGQSILDVTLQAGLSVLKNYGCGEDSERNSDCPVCADHMTTLATDLPFSNHTNSRLVCWMSGELMNEDNPPMALPNGNVYCRNALEAMAAERDGMITCPRTNRVYAFSKAQKVYIM
eukprot:m.252374 g.252374  ORF g.252374 m.252374 type:complete len:388 (-) comp15913_c0_seq2:4218-5381(-)